MSDSVARENLQQSPSEGEPPRVPRRRFLTKVTLGLSALAAAVVGLPAITFIMRGLFRQLPQQWRDIGPIEHFQPGRTVLVSFESVHGDRWSRESGKAGAWVRRESNDKFTAFSTNCTHLGCPVAWQAAAGLFLCPCHGGVYHEDGTVASGPPLLPLAKHPVRVRNGHLEIGTSAIPIA